MTEDRLHQLIQENIEVKMDILNILEINYELGFQFRHEHRIDNNMIIDFSIIQGNEIVALIECKGDNINTTDFVRGLGQAQQYLGLLDRPELLKGYDIKRSAKVALIFPSSVFSKSNFDLSNYTLYKDITLLEVNDSTESIRHINDKEIKKLQSIKKSSLITISHYYFRDNRLYELYYLLKILSSMKLMGATHVNRKEFELIYLRKLKTHNNRNWRNAFITLSSLGFTDKNNLSNRKGLSLSTMSFGEFAYEIYQGYAKPYFNEIFTVFENINTRSFSISNAEISSMIKRKYNNRDILFLTESNNRYISSWLNILRDDYGCISFQSRSSKRQIEYNITKYNRKAIIEEVNSRSCSNMFKEKFQKLLLEIDFSNFI